MNNEKRKKSEYITQNEKYILKVLKKKNKEMKL